LIPCRESRFWRVAKPRTMLLDMEYHPFWVTDKGPLRDPEIFSQPACHGRDRNAARRRSGNLRFSPQRSSIKGDALSAPGKNCREIAAGSAIFSPMIRQQLPGQAAPSTRVPRAGATSPMVAVNCLTTYLGGMQ